MPPELYFEDFHTGRIFLSLGTAEVTAEQIKSFAREYDPQPFHLDEAAGAASFFKGLAASGWMTAGLAMRLQVQALNVAGGMIGAGVEEIRWTAFVRAGDLLRTEMEVLSVRPSRSRPEYGTVRMQTHVYNQRSEVVMRSVMAFLAPVRDVNPA